MTKNDKVLFNLAIKRTKDITNNESAEIEINYNLQHAEQKLKVYPTEKQHWKAVYSICCEFKIKTYISHLYNK